MSEQIGKRPNKRNPISDDMWKLSTNWDLENKRHFPIKALERMKGYYIKIYPTDEQLDFLRKPSTPEEIIFEDQREIYATKSAIPLVGVIIPPKEATSERDVSCD